MGIEQALSIDEYMDTPQEDMKAQISESLNPPVAEDKDWRDDPRSQEIYVFDFNWQDNRGRRYEGQFSSKILTENERNMVDIMLAKLCGGTPWEHLPPGRRDFNYIRAHLTYSLVESPPLVFGPREGSGPNADTANLAYGLRP